MLTFIFILPRWCTVNRKKLPNIKCFVYVFPCDFAKKRNEVEIYGTGGMILQNMKNLLQCLPGLERLELVDLQLDGTDGMYILYTFIQTVKTCSIITRWTCSGWSEWCLPLLFEKPKDCQHHQDASLHACCLLVCLPALPDHLSSQSGGWPGWVHL